MRYDVLIVRDDTKRVSSVAAYSVPLERATWVVQDIEYLGLKPGLHAIVTDSGRFAKGDTLAAESGIQ